jgi:hypothetical protein
VARKRIDPGRRRLHARLDKEVRRSASVATMARARRTGFDKRGKAVTGIVVSQGTQNTRLALPGRAKTTQVSSKTLRKATRGEGMRATLAARKERKIEFKRAGFVAPGTPKERTMARTRRAVTVASKGRSRSGARRVYRRDVRGRFA